MKSLSATVLLATALVATTAGALPSVGDARPEVKLVDAWDRTLSVTRAANKPILVVYEDKDSAKQNQPMKDDLAKLAKGDRYKNAITLLAIADVAGYDYWPVRGFVKDAIQSESHKFSTVIYCDWDGSARNAFNVKKGVSNIVLYGRDGKVLLAHEGAMPADKRAKLIDLLRAQVGETSQPSTVSAR
jgi:Bacterial protein of unknown function (YtfJ_HI0045)